MRLIEFAKSSIHPDGTIAMLKLYKDDADKLHNWCNKHQIQCIDKDKLHCTVLYSKQPVEHLVKYNNKLLNVNADIIGWKKLGNALTLELNCPRANKIHKYMIDQGGTHDFPNYIAHISVSYNWTKDELPDLIPTININFDKLKVDAIDTNFSG